MKQTILPGSLSLALLLSLTVNATAWAHGPSRKKVEVSQAVAASPTVVWGLVGDFQNMSWLPVVAKTEGTGGNTPGASRTLTLSSGGQVIEKLEKYDPSAHSYFYRIEQVDPKVFPVTNYSSTLSVAAAPDGTSVVTWKGAFYRGYPNNDPPPELSDDAAVAAVTGLYQTGLTNLKALAEKAAQ